MKKIAIVPMMAVLALGLAACSKTDDTSNVTTTESNTVVEDTDANLSAVDGIDNVETDATLNSEVSNETTNSF